MEFDILYVSSNVFGYFFIDDITMDNYMLTEQIIGGVTHEEGAGILKTV